MRNKFQIVISILLAILQFSCNQIDYDVIIEQADGTTKMFKCKIGKDTLNSAVYRFYDRILVEKWNYVNGKKEGAMITYHPDGKIKIITNYINDTVQGVNKVYDSTGVLIRRSFYIKNRQVLFEQFLMENENHPGIYKSTLVHKNKYNELIFAGELYVDKNNKPTSIEYLFHKGKLDSIEYKGRYVTFDVNDTLILNEEYTLNLNITSPEDLINPEILIGEFDTNLKCIDTSFFAKPDSMDSSFGFHYRPNKAGDNYIIGRFSNPDVWKDTLYFFDEFFVK